VRLTRLAAPACAYLVLATVTGCTSSTVVRVIDGTPVAGRFVSDRAYAYYARAADAEARGDLPDALGAYEAAAAEDDGAEIWTRIGAVRCALLGAAGDGVADAWRRAEAIDASYEPLWRERARCALAAGKPADALALSERAVALDPEQDEASVVHAATLERLGRAIDARRELEALVVRHPSSASGWRALRALAERAGDVGTVARASAHLGADAVAPVRANGTTWADLDRALLRGDVDVARRRALAEHLPLAELAVRAAALARPAVARPLAELVLAADPADGSARVALAAAADLSGDADALGRALIAPTSIALTPPSPLARLVLAELLARRVGPAAARAAYEAPAPEAVGRDADALYDEVERRLRARLGGAS
jgi:tetratricopeptide (TPR) repeat protein